MDAFSATLQDDVRRLQGATRLRKTRLDEELLDSGLGNDITSVRFADEDYQNIKKTSPLKFAQRDWPMIKMLH